MDYNGYQWDCSDGHATTVEDGAINTIDENGKTVYRCAAKRAAINRLEDGECPICDGWATV